MVKSLQQTLMTSANPTSIGCSRLRGAVQNIGWSAKIIVAAGVQINVTTVLFR